MTSTVLQASLDGQELAALLSMAGLGLGELSPLEELPAGSPPALSEESAARLAETGWLAKGDRGGLTPAAREALTVLCQPRLKVGLVLGTGDSLYTANSFSAEGLADDRLLSYAYTDDEHRLIYPQPRVHLVDLLKEHFDLGVVREGVPFQGTFSLPEYVAFLCILDWHLYAYFKQILNRDYWVDTDFAVQDAWEMLIEGRLAGNLNWQVTTRMMLFPDAGFTLTEKALGQGLAGLEASGQLTQMEDGRYRASENLATLCENVLPVIAYAGVRLDRLIRPGEVEATHFAVCHGPGAILLEQLTTDEDGKPMMELSGMNSVALVHILFNLGSPAIVVCPSCGEEIAPGRKFCTQCGTRLVAPSGRKGR
jgi:hypothetical protein